MIFDANVWLGNWPFRDLKNQDAPALSSRLLELGIDRALVSPCEGVFYRNPDEANTLLLDRLQGVAGLHPAVIVDPSLPGWEADMDRYVDAGVRACRLLPGYHSYSLTSDAAASFLLRHPEILVILQVRVEDERSQHPRCMVPPAAMEEIIDLVGRYPGRRFLVSCAGLAEATRLGEETSNTVIELSYVESLDTLRALLDAVSDERVVFGSHTPFFYTHSALAKMRCAGVSAGALARVESQTLTGLFQG